MGLAARLIASVRRSPKPFKIALLLSVIVAILGAGSAVIATYYESAASLEFSGNAPDSWTFVLHLQADGPMTTYKDITVKSVQVLGYPQSDVSRVTLLLRSEKALWIVNISRLVNYEAGSPVNEFWIGSPSDGKFVFTQSGSQNVSAVIWVTLGITAPAPQGTKTVLDVLPKESDDAWNSGRIAIISLVVGVAFFAIPATVKEFRDPYRDT